MLTITSSSNPKIKLVRALQTQAQQRKGQGAFVAEGVRLLEDAISAGWPMDYILFDQTLSERGQLCSTPLRSNLHQLCLRFHPT
jgi:RNA methyltransferase, TrmH family